MKHIIYKNWTKAFYNMSALNTVRMLLALFMCIFLEGTGATAKEKARPLTPYEADKLFKNVLINDDEGDNYVEALEVLSHADGYKQHIPYYCAKALTRYGWVLTKHNQTTLATNMLLEAQKYLSPKDSILKYDIMSGLGNCYLNSGQFTKAKMLLLKLLDYHKRMGMFDKYIADLNNLGIYFMSVGQTGRAYTCWKRVQVLAKNKHLWHWVFEVNRNLSFLITNSSEKINLLRTTLDIEMRNNLPQLLPQTHYYLSLAYFENQEYDRAIAEAQIALEGAHSIAESVDSTEVMRLMAKIYTARQNFELAAHYYSETDKRMSERMDSANGRSDRGSRIASDLMAWCRNNVIMKNDGDFELRSSNGTDVTLRYFFIATIMLLVCIVCMAVMFKVKREKERDMSRTINYLLLFYNNQNVLLTKIFNLIRQVAGRDTDNNSRLRNIGHFIQENKLDNFETKYTAWTQRQTDGFTARLIRRYPNLTETEKQMAVFLWLGLSTHEICVLTGNQPRSVNTNRYRLRKSMSLGNEEDLVSYLQSI